MKSFCRVPVFEQLEQKRLLAADSCEHEPAYTSLEPESAPIVAAQVEAANESFSASADLQNDSTTDGTQTRCKNDGKMDEGQESSSEGEDRQKESDNDDDTDNQEENGDDQGDDDDMMDRDDDSTDIDDETDEQTDKDQSNGDQMENDETDDDEMVDDDTDGDSTDIHDETDDMDGDDMDDGDNTELDDETDQMDGDDMDDGDNTEMDDEETDDTTTQPETTSPSSSQETTVGQPLFDANESGLSSQTVPISGTARTEALRATTQDSTTSDLLLAVTGNDESDEPESAEFVGVSDQRDAAPSILNADSIDVDFDAVVEGVKPPALPGDR